MFEAYECQDDVHSIITGDQRNSNDEFKFHILKSLLRNLFV